MESFSRMYGNPEVKSGKKNEIAALGKPRQGMSFDEFKNTYRNFPEHKREEEIGRLMDYVREIQFEGTQRFGSLELTIGPTNPQKLFARKLQRGVASELGVSPELVKFYTAVGTALDYLGVDAFMDIHEVADGPPVATITVDHKSYAGSGEWLPADVRVTYGGEDPREDKELFHAHVREAVSDAIQALRGRVIDKAA